MRGSNPAARIAAANSFGESGVRRIVTSTSALKRGTPWTTTACAPNTYQGPHDASTRASAARSSRAAVSIGTPQQLRQPNVCLEIRFSMFSAGPTGDLLQDLAPELVGNAERLGCAQMPD